MTWKVGGLKTSFNGFVFVSLFLLLGLFVSASMVVETHAPDVAANGTNWTLTGWVWNSSNVGVQGFQGINITVNFNATHAPYALTNGSGWFEVNVSVPAAVANIQYNFTIYANDTNYTLGTQANVTKNMSFYSSDIPNATLAFINSTPPFSVGTTFYVNVTLKDAAGALVVGHVAPPVAVYLPDGQRQSWSVVNNSATTDASGSITYSVTVPASANGGTYILLVEGIQQNGGGVLVFGVSGGYYVSSVAKDTTGQPRMFFSQGGSVVIEAQVRNSSGLAAATVAGTLQYPNATTAALTLAGTVAGIYNVTITAPTAGTYNVTINAVSSALGFDLTSSTMFMTQNFSTRFDFLTSGPQKEFGGVRAFPAGGQAKIALVITNVSSGTDLTTAVNGNEDASPRVINCTKYNNTALSLKNLATSVVSSTVVNSSIIASKGSNYCVLNFTAPASAGDYLASMAVSLNQTSVGAANIVITSANYVVSLRPVFALGNTMMPVDFVYPGTNVSFSISAYNLSGGQTLAAGNVSTATLMSLIPVFTSNGSTSSAIAYQSYSSASGSPVITFTAPGDAGPYRFTVIVNVSNENVTSEGFFMSSYVTGHVEPKRTGMEMGPPSSPCSGAQSFSVQAFDVRTNQFAVGVYVNSVQELREESTGRKIDNCLSITPTSTQQSDASNRETLVQGAFGAGCGTLSEGSYFMMVNVTYNQKSDLLPGGFMCRQASSLRFFPDIWPATGAMSMRMGPPRINKNSPILVKVQGVFNGTGQVTRGYMQVTQAQRHAKDFNDVWTNNTLLNTTLASSTATLVVYPQNFSYNGVNRTVWQPDFIELTVKVCDWSGHCGTQNAGFEVQSFDAFFDPTSFQSLFQATPNSNVSILINVSTNLSTVGNITVEAGKPWEGIWMTITPFNVSLNQDKWNTTADTGVGYEQWFVNLTLPATLPRDGFDITFRLKNFENDETRLHGWVGTPPMAPPSTEGQGGGPSQMGAAPSGGAFASASRYRVTIPFQEEVQVWADSMLYQPVNMSDEASNPFMVVDGWNMSALYRAYSVASQSNRTCFKRQFNSSRFTPPNLASAIPSSYTYNASWKMMVVDNGTPGTYNLVVINDTQYSGGNGHVYAVSMNSTAGRTIAPGVYLWDIYDCPGLLILNSSLTSNGSIFNNFGGMYPNTAALHTVRFPVVVYDSRSGEQTMTAVNNGNVTVSAIVQQQDFGGGGQNMGGAGFSNALAVGTDYDNPSQVSTDSSGVAFMSVNFVNNTAWGPMNMLWGLQASDGNNYTAYMQEGIMFELRPYEMYVNSYTNQLPYRIINLSYDATNGQYPYGAYYQEVNGNDLTNDSLVGAYYLNYTPATSILYINETILPTSIAGTHNASKVDSFRGQGDGFASEYLISGLFNDTTYAGGNGRIQLRFLQKVSGAPPSHTLTAGGTNNVSLIFCAHDFSKTMATAARGILGMRLTQESPGGQTTQTLLLADPVNGTWSAHIPTAPQGCTGIVAKPSTTWPASQQGFARIEMLLTAGGTTMQSFGGDVRIQ